MTDMVTVRAGWALWGKQPGTRHDYSVLACSPEPFSRADFAAIITRFAAGSPDVTATGPAALPWVTVSWVGVDDDPHLGVSITGDSGQVDGVGRPITQTAYFCVPYAQLVRTPVSYCDLYDAIVAAAPSLRPADGPMIRLNVRAMSGDRLTDAVRHAGEETVRAAAALVLSRPVSVVQAEGTSLRDRLEFIDAVASLLPYGYRVRFSAATWSDSGTKHRVRLAFAARPREDAGVVRWRRKADVPAADRLALDYCDRLARLSQEPARSREGLGLPAVIGHLALDAEPRRFEQPQDALDSLNRLDQPFRVLRSVRGRTGVSLVDLREVLRLDRAKNLPDEADRTAVLSELAEHGDTQDWPLLRSEVTALHSAEDRARILTAFGRRMLWDLVPPEAELTSACLRLASDLGFEDTALAELIRPPDKAADYSAELRAAAGLLADTVLAPRSTGRDYPHTSRLLSASPVAAADYVAALSRAGQAGPLLSWLDPQGASVLSRAFRVGVGIDEGWTSDADLAELGASGRACVGALLRASAQTGHLDRVLPGFAHWLAGRPEPNDAERRYWIAQLSGVEPRGVRPQAWLDTVLLMIGGLPSSLPPVERKAAVDYGNDVAGIWTGLSKKYPSFNAKGCVRALAGYLNERPWTVSGEQALAVSELVKRLHDFDQGGVLGATVASALAATPAARSWDFAQEWLAWAAANQPEAVRERLLDALAAAPPGADPGYLAGLCASACCEGIDSDAALYPLAKSGALTSAAQGGQLLSALEQQFDEAGIDDETVLAWRFRLSELFARGVFGTELGREMRAQVSEWIRRDLWLGLRLLATFAEEGRERQYEWTEAEREELSAIAGAIESMLKKSRKFQLPKKFRIPFGGPDENVLDQVPGSGAEVIAEGSSGEAAGPQDTVTMPGLPG
jgi:hypothetical protein